MGKEAKMNHPVDSWEYIKQHKLYYAFRLTGISFAYLVMFSALISGCQSKNSKKYVKPQPKIRIDRSETNSYNSVRVSFENHEWDRGEGWIGNPHADLNNLKEVQAYKKEVEFLLKELEQAEQKMEIHEDKPNGPQTTSP